MSEIIDHIHKDHENMARMLALLEFELRDLAEGKDHDLSLLENIMDWFNHYPAHYHHPFEDEVFNWIGGERPALQREINSLRDDHETQAASSSELLAMIKGIQSGHIVPREQLVGKLGDFIDTQRNHIDTEEKHLLKEAEGVLAGARMEEIPIPDRERLDPLFGAEQRAEFAIAAEALARSIQ